MYAWSACLRWRQLCKQQYAGSNFSVEIFICAPGVAVHLACVVHETISYAILPGIVEFRGSSSGTNGSNSGLHSTVEQLQDSVACFNSRYYLVVGCSLGTCSCKDNCRPVLITDGASKQFICDCSHSSTCAVRSKSLVELHFAHLVAVLKPECPQVLINPHIVLT